MQFDVEYPGNPKLSAGAFREAERRPTRPKSPVWPRPRWRLLQPRPAARQRMPGTGAAV